MLITSANNADGAAQLHQEVDQYVEDDDRDDQYADRYVDDVDDDD